MKVLVALAVIALCGMQIASAFNPLDTLRAGINRQKTTVQNTVNRLQRHKREFESNLNRKLSDAKINSMQEINSIVNPTLKNIEDAAAKSTAAGKDASACYENARAALRQYSLTGFSDLDSCRNDALSSVSETQNSIDNAILTGQQVISNLDSIFPSCFTANILQMQSCIVGKLPEATQLARSFESAANTIISSTTSVASAAQTNAVNCNKGPVNTVRQGANSAQENANQCIADL